MKKFIVILTALALFALATPKVSAQCAGPAFNNFGYSGAGFRAFSYASGVDPFFAPIPAYAPVYGYGGGQLLNINIGNRFGRRFGGGHFGGGHFRGRF